MTERTYPQPREGVAGTDRSEDPMLASIIVKDRIGVLTRLLFHACLSSQYTDEDRARAKRLITPQPGDLVVVMDSVFQDEETRFQGVGYLLATRDEWGCTDEEWAASKAADESLTDADRTVFTGVSYVQYGPNPADVCRWSNAVVDDDRHRHLNLPTCTQFRTA